MHIFFFRNVNTDWVTPYLLTHPSLPPFLSVQTFPPCFHLVSVLIHHSLPFSDSFSQKLSLPSSPRSRHPLTQTSSLSLPRSDMPRLSPAIICPCAGRVVPQPERLITFLPPAVYTSVLAATPIHYLPWSRAAHSSPLSATPSFTALNPQPWQSAAAQQDTSAINPEEDRVAQVLDWIQRLIITYFCFFLGGIFASHGNGLMSSEKEVWVIRLGRGISSQ